MPRRLGLGLAVLLVPLLLVLWLTKPANTSEDQAVRIQAPALVGAVLNLNNLPANVTGRQRLISSAPFLKNFSEQSSQIWDLSVFPTQYEASLADLRLRAATAEMEMQEAARLEDVSMERADAHGDRATASFVARTARRSSTTHQWIEEGRSHFSCSFRRTPDHQWRLTRLSSTSLDGQG